MPGNWFSTIALVAWPLVAFALYRKRPLTQATMWTVLAAQMLLPVGLVIKFKMIPQFDKDTIPCLCILVGCLMVARRGLKLFRGFGLTEVLILMYLVSPIITSELNGDALWFGDRFVPGVGLYDAISAVESSFILLIPFLIGRQFLRDAATTRDIMLVLVLAGLVYSLPMLFEIRFAPQLHYWVYGYSPSDFSQSVRDGGFRPMVFMGHGLLAALFAMMSAVAAAALWRTRTPVRTPLQTLPPGGVTAYLSVVLILYKSLGAAIYALVAIPLVRWTRPKLQMRDRHRAGRHRPAVSAALHLQTVSAPVSAGAPQHRSARARPIAAKSFTNETRLLDHALERPVFGWGRYGRNRVYNAETGTR